MDQQQPKILPMEAGFLLMYIGLTDLIGIGLVVFALDDLFILDVLTFPVTQLYFRMKGVNKIGYDLAANLIELVPYLGALPLRTVGVLVVIWIDQHPTGAVAKVTVVAAKVVPAKKPAKAAAPTLEGIRKAA